MRRRRKIKFVSRPSPAEHIEALKKYVGEAFNAELDLLVEVGKLRETCFDNICLIYQGVNELPRAVFSGELVGIVIEGHVAPSPQLYTKLFQRYGCRSCVVAADKGVKAFLYGNDLLLESVAEIYPPVDSYVAVLDSYDYSVIGVAKWDESSKVFKNVFDLGVYLRKLG
ncbi:MAG: hypothetical protein JHC12_04180 [Thermogladius sp.]|nr:hypothetical protein [Thermogladius sp.]